MCRNFCICRSDDLSDEQKLDYIKSHIREYTDFPKRGFIFRELFVALTDPMACIYLKELLVGKMKQTHPNVDIMVGLESRGFLFNLLIATELGVGCAPVRKKGKLPGKCVSEDFRLEYGKDTFEMQTTALKPGQKVVIIDDFMATGGSLHAAGNLVRKNGGEVLGSLVVMESTILDGRKQLDFPVISLIQY